MDVWIIDFAIGSEIILESTALSIKVQQILYLNLVAFVSCALSIIQRIKVASNWSDSEVFQFTIDYKQQETNRYMGEFVRFSEWLHLKK